MVHSTKNLFYTDMPSMYILLLVLKLKKAKIQTFIPLHVCMYVRWASFFGNSLLEPGRTINFIAYCPTNL